MTNLLRQGFRTYLPLRARTTRHARQFRTVLASLFPGYVFVALDLASDRWRSVNGTRGVVSLVMTGAEPVPVPKGVVESLVEISSQQGVVRFDPNLQLGHNVKIIAGPFAEQFGTLERLDGQGRVQVLLEMMGTHVRVASRACQLTPA